MTLITDDELRKWEAICEKAHAKPWKVEPDYKNRGMEIIGDGMGIALYLDKQDADFIICSRSALPRLIAEVEQQRHDIAIYKDHIRRSGHRPEDMDKCTCHIDIRDGEVAMISNDEHPACNVPIYCCKDGDEVKRLRE